MAAAPTHVYILGFSDRVIKVGRTSNPARRRHQHSESAKIRRAVIVNEWLLETPHSIYAERMLRIYGHDHLETLSGTEWFSGKYPKFVRHIEKKFRHFGLMPAETITHAEILSLGVHKKALGAAVAWDELTPWRDYATKRTRFMRDEFDAWLAGPYQVWLGEISPP